MNTQKNKSNTLFLVENNCEKFRGRGHGPCGGCRNRDMWVLMLCRIYAAANCLSATLGNLPGTFALVAAPSTSPMARAGRGNEINRISHREDLAFCENG